jgi:hypothetical protein
MDSEEELSALEEVRGARQILEQLDNRIPRIQESLEESLSARTRWLWYTLGLIGVGVVLTVVSVAHALGAADEARDAADTAKELAQEVAELQTITAWNQYDALIASCERGNDAVNRAAGAIRAIIEGVVGPSTPQETIDAAFGPLDTIEPRDCSMEIEEPTSSRPE